MHILLTGASGFIGRGVLFESLAAEDVARVTVLARRPIDVEHPKLAQVSVEDFTDPSAARDVFAEVDACFWCLGTASGGMDEETYTRITHTFALAAGSLLREANPAAHFSFLSGSGADGRAMWARVKKRTEDDLRALGFESYAVYRPAFIRGGHGAELRGAGYKFFYYLVLPFTPIVRALGGGTSNIEIGRAMLNAARSRVLDGMYDSKGINGLAASAG